MTKQETRTLPIGTYVWCNVTAIRTWYRVTEVRQRDGYIRIDNGYRSWNPPFNFSLTDNQGRRWSEL